MCIHDECNEPENTVPPGVGRTCPIVADLGRVLPVHPDRFGRTSSINHRGASRVLGDADPLGLRFGAAVTRAERAENLVGISWHGRVEQRDPFLFDGMGAVAH